MENSNGSHPIFKIEYHLVWFSKSRERIPGIHKNDLENQDLSGAFQEETIKGAQIAYEIFPSDPDQFDILPEP